MRLHRLPGVEISYRRDSTLAPPRGAGCITALREEAAGSPSRRIREEALCMLHDLDSFAFVADNSPYPEAREGAREGLRRRLSSFPAPAVEHISLKSGSEAVRAEAVAELRRRG
jgi:hypothetical protein